MISFIGLVSLPVLLLSIAFIYFHTKFIKLYNAYESRKNTLQELLLHKQELLLFFARDDSTIIHRKSCDELSDAVSQLMDSLKDFDFSDEDRAELDDISKEIEDAWSAYNVSKDMFEGFITAYPGKLLFIFLAERSVKL